MVAQSSIPGAIDALVSTLSAVTGDTVNVVDGPPLAWEPLTVADSVNDKLNLFIGTQIDSATSIEGTHEYNAAGAVSQDERYDIYCTIFVWDGDTNIKQRRDDAFTIFGDVRTAISNDPTLGDAIMYCHIEQLLSVEQEQTNGGSHCAMVFTIACRAYLTD